MRRILLCFLFVVAALSAWAQTRIVRGYVTDESGVPMGGVTVKAQTGEQFTTAADGKFKFPVSFHCRSLTFSLEKYYTATVEIDGSYMMVSMKYDNTAELAAQRAEEARRAAAEEAVAAALLAREKAIRDSLRIEAEKQKARLEEEKRQKEAAEKARLAAEKAAAAALLAREKAVRDSLRIEEQKQKARMEEEKRQKEAAEKAVAAALLAREKAVRDSLRIEEQKQKARMEEERRKKEAEEKARLAAEKAAAAALLAREKAVRDSLRIEEQKQKARLEAEEKARLAAEEKAKKEAEAKARAEKKRLAAEENSRKDKAYDEQFVNHGLEHSVDISYAYSLSRGYVRYVYSGYRDVGSTHPVEVDYTLSYRFSRLISVGGGVGLLYHLKSVSILNDDYIPAYEKFREKQLDIPVFARLKLNFLRTKVRPLVNVQAGCYCLSGVFYGEAGVGVEYRMGKQLALQLSASLRTVPWPRFNEQKGASYVISLAPGVKLGVSF